MNSILKLYLWSFEWVNQEHVLINPYHIGGKLFYDSFVQMLEKIETLDVPLMTWKIMEEINVNQFKLVVISKF